MSRKALLIALLASLALNTLLGGLMIGGRYAERHRGMPESAMRQLAAIVPAAHRDAVRAAIRANRRELMQAMREVRRARKQVSAVASAEHPSHDALAAALLQLRTATQHAQTLMHEAILAGSLDAGSAESGAP